MPKQPKLVCKRTNRQVWMAVLLLPSVGCSLSLPAWKPNLPWVGDPIVESTEATNGTLVGKETPIVQLVSQVIASEKSAQETTSAETFAADFEEGLDPVPAPIELPGLNSPDIDSQNPHPLVVAGPSEPQVIDLASALGMAGGNAWSIQLARQRTMEAHANLQQAKALWLPSLQFGVGWNKHDGRIQATNGEVIEVSRGSLFVGGGATLGAPLAGGSGGPLRLSADLALADAYFAPKIAIRQVSARKADISVARNLALRDAGLAYIDLLEAAGQVADSQVAIVSAGELLDLTRKFDEAGAGARADVDRAATEHARLGQQLHNANRLYRVRSASLSRRLRLDPRTVLQPADQVIVPIELSADSQGMESLIAIAMGQRPEINSLSHEITGLCIAVRQANVDPWIPHVTMVSSSGNYGGGKGSRLDAQASRSDVDLQAVWEIENLGVGVTANRNRAGARLSQRRVELADLRDQITSDVVSAFEDVISYRAQIDSANQAMVLAEASYTKNLQRVQADEGLPIELLQAITAKANSLRVRTVAVAHYNRAQLRLLHASGQLRH